MSAVLPRITVDDYLDLLKECFIEYQGAHAIEPWHPEDLYANLSVLMHPLALGLARGKQFVKLNDKYWPKNEQVPVYEPVSREDPL